MNGSAEKPSRPLEVADIVREHGDDFFARYRVPFDRRRVLADVARCRTATLGGHVEQCNSCPHEKVAYNSCRNRHCPKCQGSVAARWMQDRSEELLDVPYFHVVFTLPDEIAAIALQNPRVVYGILFQAVGQTLQEVAATPKHLGAKIGFLAVLHTWGQNPHHHPHLHCVVPAGGLSACGTKWVHTKKQDFFLPVRVLSRVFRGKFIALLQRAYDLGKLEFHGQLSGLAQPGAWQHRLNVAVRNEWVVYSKAPFGGPEVVLKYLARYTHRVAISNRRLLRLNNGQVTFRVKDYAAGGRQTTCTLTAVEFIRRYLQHVLPRGFMRIRHFGFMANRFRRENLDQCRQLLDMALRSTVTESETPIDQPSNPTGDGTLDNEDMCPVCRRGRLLITRLIREDEPHLQPIPKPHPGIAPTSTTVRDTS